MRARYSLVEVSPRPAARHTDWGRRVFSLRCLRRDASFLLALLGEPSDPSLRIARAQRNEWVSSESSRINDSDPIDQLCAQRYSWLKFARDRPPWHTDWGNAFFRCVGLRRDASFLLALLWERLQTRSLHRRAQRNEWVFLQSHIESMTLTPLISGFWKPFTLSLSKGPFGLPAPTNSPSCAPTQHRARA